MNFQEIKEVDDAEDGIRIVFHSNQVLLALVKSETMKEYMKNARLVKIIYLNRHFQRFEGICEASLTGFRESGANIILIFEIFVELLNTRQQKISHKIIKAYKVSTLAILPSKSSMNCFMVRLER